MSLYSVRSGLGNQALCLSGLVMYSYHPMVDFKPCHMHVRLSCEELFSIFLKKISSFQVLSVGQPYWCSEHRTRRSEAARPGCGATAGLRHLSQKRPPMKPSAFSATSTSWRGTHAPVKDSASAILKPHLVLHVDNALFLSAVCPLGACFVAAPSPRLGLCPEFQLDAPRRQGNTGGIHYRCSPYARRSGLSRLSSTAVNASRNVID